MFAVFGVAWFVGELALLHERDRDSEKESGHGDCSADIPVKTVKCTIHHPYTPPEQDLTEIVRMTTMFPQTYVAYFTGIGSTEIRFIRHFE